MRRTTMWKKSLTVALAAAMMTGLVSIPAVFNSSVAIVKAKETQTSGLKDPKTLKAVDGYYYATVNMEYADYYYGEVNRTVNVTSLDLSKGDIVDAKYADGSYDAVTSATTTKSKGFPTTYYTENVKNNETGDEATGVNINGIADVQIRIPVALYQAYYNAYTQNKDKNLSVYQYLANAKFSDSAFDEYKELNGDGTFKATTSTSEVKSEVTAAITSTSNWGNWQISVENLPSYVTKKSMEGVILETSDGEKYGLLHEDNLWLQPKEISFAAREFTEPHGNHVAYAHTKGLNGKTIKKITYLLRKTDAYEEKGRDGSITQVPACDGKDLVIHTNLYVKPLLSKNQKITVSEGAYSESGTKVKVDTSRAPKDANYNLTKVTKGAGRAAQVIDPTLYSYKDGILTLDKSLEIGDDYTITLESEKYADVKLSVSIKKATDISVATSLSISKVYGDKAIDLGAKSVEGTTLSYKTSNKKVADVSDQGVVTIKGTGSATITVTAFGEGFCTETKKVAIKVVPKKQNVKVKAGKQKLDVSWTKDNQASGYQLQVGLKSNFKGAKTYSVTTYKTYKKTIKSLKSKKKYYVRVRSYKSVGKTKLYGAYSAVKSITVK